MSGELTPVEKITVANVRTGAGFPKEPRDLPPELQLPVARLRGGEELTDKQIVEMVEAEVQHNSNF